MPVKFSALLVALLLAVMSLALPAQAFERADRPDFAQTSVRIDRGDGTVLTFLVELALSPRQHAYGLMHVDRMPPDRGMPAIFHSRMVLVKDLLSPMMCHRNLLRRMFWRGSSHFCKMHPL